VRDLGASYRTVIAYDIDDIFFVDVVEIIFVYPNHFLLRFFIYSFFFY